MSLNIKPRQQNDHSNPYYCIHSLQKLNSEFDTNVFTTSIPISQLLKNRDILLVDDLKADAKWGMNKIIQRNISDKRVKEIKNEYLDTNHRQIKFFPAITIILLPKTSGEPSQSFNNSQNSFDDIAGIDVIKEYGETDLYLYDHPITLKWDKNKISALVIDGQHRVKAIRSFYDSKNEAHYDGISIPATFVVFKNSPNLDLIQATRALFIDVNNTPRLVSEEKLIFIDDRNIHRRITAKIFGSNDPGDDSSDYYQKMLQQEDFLLNEENILSRYLVEESGKDDEESRGFLSNHRNLFPWEVSNIMTIHRNIIGNILLRFKDVDKTRDIRSLCHELNNSILEEIEKKESTEELTDKEREVIVDRLAKSGLSNEEIDIFKNLMDIKYRNLEEIRDVESEFLIGTAADDEEEKDRKDFVKLLLNIYNQDCSKDSAFEFSSNSITNLLLEKCSIYISLPTYVFNNLWFTKNIKNSILDHGQNDRKLIFNFILATHETLKVQNSLRRRNDKVDKQVKNFIKQYEISETSRVKTLTNWAKSLAKSQNGNVLRTVVGQEMLFIYLMKQSGKLRDINIENELEIINTLGDINFFNSEFLLKIKFPEALDCSVLDFQIWSEIIMNGNKMKPGITNAMKGADFIDMVKNKISNRINGGSKLRSLDRLQKSYGVAVTKKIAEGDNEILFKMYEVAQDYFQLDKYLNNNEIEIITEHFANAEQLTDRSKNVLSKLYGGYAFEQVVECYKDKI
ncbi:DNA sulfur modification protein DndB [Mesonia mobilis]|uniref:DGQHR domain-containing protein n=1 Tax=Mesonia mobilis TaxID=369791 RepID=A0ABQ3BKM2_9FLAO|nr:DNA sulfur modification protein DndB [Mesonia mobilis]MBQ0739368.1 hypothetical protein [Aquimarina celericrescens]GGZ49028.1 hypothetical protein GCM10008088_07960 [Mesonia mobilis]